MDSNTAPKEDASKKATIAQAPFNNEGADADIILRSSDKVDFYVHKLLLRMASSFFADMFIVAASTPGQGASPPIVDIAESSSTMNSILRVCYPVDEVKEASLDKVAEVLEAAMKYEVRKAITNMKKELLTYILMAPISVYAKACTLNLEDEACRAAVGWRLQYDSKGEHPHLSVLLLRILWYQLGVICSSTMSGLGPIGDVHTYI
ncbi:hypothetical protein QCA50_008656 [Cerrena zonata]|uniref:BTB domain-containing protein n=1 Tax=Cerrena zonata TaxID=2478898 RepID=A0AAW0G648_9APHY